MSVLVYSRARLLADLGDIFGETISSTSYHPTAECVRVANGIARALSRQYSLRLEEWTFDGDGDTEFWPFPVSFASIQRVTVDGRKSTPISFNDRLDIFPFSPYSGLAPSHYVRPEGLGFYPPVGSGLEIIAYMRALIPRVRDTDTALTTATWTNGSDVVSAITTAQLTSALFDPGDGVLAPDGRVYTGKLHTENSPSADTLTLTEPYRGSTVTGTSGACTIGGHFAVDEKWWDVIKYGTALELLAAEDDEGPKFKMCIDRYGAAMESATESEKNFHGQRPTR